MTIKSLSSRAILMNRRTWQGALAGFALAGATTACSSDKLNVPNYNSPTVEGIAKDPQGVQLLVMGIFDDARFERTQFTRDAGIFGREVYNYFTTDGRTVSNYLVGIPGPQRLDPAGFAAGRWNTPYQNMKNAVALIDAANASALTAAGKAGVAGFAKTMRANDLFEVIQTRDTLGAPVDIPTSPSTPAPFVSRDSVYRFISALLDDAKANLGAAGPTFPVTLTSGFKAVNTPPTFLKLNRALAAKVLVFRGSMGCGNTCYQAALTALGESFVSAPGAAASQADLDVGAYFDYSTATGDRVNSNSFAQDNYIYAHAQFADSARSAARQQTNGQPDARFLRKLEANSPVDPPGKQNVAAVWHYKLYPTPSSPQPLIRNEELILLRAEANIRLGNLAAAYTDLNTIRTVSGGQAPLPAGLSAAQLFDELVYQKWASTLFEGTRWADMRRWGLLNRLPLDQPSHFVARVMPIPIAECDARVQKPNGC